MGVEHYPEGSIVRVADMDPVERAFAVAEHETCEEFPIGHPLTDHEPWSGGDLDGVETWRSFTDRLSRHGLTIVLEHHEPDDVLHARQVEDDWARAAFMAADGPIGGEG